MDPSPALVVLFDEQVTAADRDRLRFGEELFGVECGDLTHQPLAAAAPSAMAEEQEVSGFAPEGGRDGDRLCGCGGAGQIVEEGTTEQIFAAPHHPYTRDLLGATTAGRFDEAVTGVEDAGPAAHGEPALYGVRCVNGLAEDLALEFQQRVAAEDVRTRRFRPVRLQLIGCGLRLEPGKDQA